MGFHCGLLFQVINQHVRSVPQHLQNKRICLQVKTAEITGSRSVVDLHSKNLDTPHPSPSANSFNFMQYLGKFGKIVCWHPPEGWHLLVRGILDLPLL